MTIGEKIRVHRKQLGLTQTELGKLLGVKTNAVSKWECGRVEDIPTSKIKAMASLFSVPPSYLIDDGPSEPQSLLGKAVANVLPHLASKQAPVVDLQDAEPVVFTSRAPIVGHIAAGLPMLAVENIEGYVTTDLPSGGQYIALRVKGDSMNAARINEGDILIVRLQDEVDDGEIAVVLVDNEEATVKRFYRAGSTVTLLPQSTNPAHTPQIYDLARTNIRIIGKVVKAETYF